VKKGTLKLAYKLLVNDKSKFTALLLGITFAVFLIMFVTSMFSGVLNHASSTIINIGASHVGHGPSRGNRVQLGGHAGLHSGRGSKHAWREICRSSLFGRGSGQAFRWDLSIRHRHRIGRHKPVRQARLIEGKIEDIYAENGFIAVRDAEFPKLENPHIGSELELNDYRGVIVGIAKVTVSGLFGTPTLYTTYERAIQYIPNPRYTISYVLVEPKSINDIPQIKKQVEALGYQARTKKEFMQRTADFFIYQTGGGTNMLIMTAISFIVGLSISGQTFYTFILENLERFGALKAIGTKAASW
jgi:putative ABC transport system permease protein